MSPMGSVDAITLDCRDPQALAGFYRAVTGRETVFDTYEFVYLAGEGSFSSDSSASTASRHLPGPAASPRPIWA